MNHVVFDQPTNAPAETQHADEPVGVTSVNTITSDDEAATVRAIFARAEQTYLAHAEKQAREAAVARQALVARTQFD